MLLPGYCCCCCVSNASINIPTPSGCLCIFGMDDGGEERYMFDCVAVAAAAAAAAAAVEGSFRLGRVCWTFCCMCA